jgi:NADH-quinone oxidoreductase subunit N
VTSVALFSLAGMPLFAGFLTKFIFFQSVAENDYYWLAAVAVVASFISLYYYLVVMKAIYVTHATETTRLRIPVVMQGSVVVLALLVFFVGLYPQPLFDLTDSVSAVLFASS